MHNILKKYCLQGELHDMCKCKFAIRDDSTNILNSVM